MSKIFQKAKSFGKRTKAFMFAAVATILSPVAAAAQSLAGTGYEAGTSAMEEVANQIVAYVPYVVNLCYALAGVVAVVGAISVYIAIISTCFLPLPNHSKSNQFERLSLT